MKRNSVVAQLPMYCSCSPNYDLQSACLLKHSGLSTSTSNMKSWCQISWWLSNYCYNINSVARACFIFLLSTLMSPALTRNQHDAIDCKKFARLILRVISKGLMIETPASYSFYSVNLSLVNQFDTKVSWFSSLPTWPHNSIRNRTLQVHVTFTVSRLIYSVELHF